ncbi:uncharacterized protein N7469_008928 [Penicillium citrinum]|uniref:Uncharacterized protein n=1 Tax=Penicillium citrinum TaxID=5077 RepID=A0A9W9NMY4_PENCI|nr:uncharacterized protein N7469_008928 [Penicillium citrinum]KAJ5222688.1 hypothetical protein N7469_008928 [Penicillium citrinum]
MGLFRVSTTLLTLLVAIWWAISERNYTAILNTARLSTSLDPIYTVEQEDLENAVYCPVNVPNAKETVLLVHGTGITLMNDIQISAEYLSYAINHLSTDSPAGSGRISIISWSAGALTTQWTLTFYPQTREKVKRFIAIGADFHGSWSMVPLVYLNMYTPAIVQQVPWSKFHFALVKFGGGRAQVPTTSIGSSTDLMIQPGFYGEGWEWAGFRDSWRLRDGEEVPVSNVDVFKVCAGMAIGERRFPHVVSHDSLLWDAASQKVIFDALHNEEIFVGIGNVSVDDCRGGMAEGLPLGSEERHAEIMPELSDYAPKMPVSGWPEIPLFSYVHDG